MSSPERSTIVAFHAHPDDEALLSGGMLALASARGHRVVLVTATRGEAGLAGRDDGHGESLARRRMEELAIAGQALDCARTVWLGYADSGIDGNRPGGFAGADVGEAASRLVDILRSEDAAVLLTGDRNGGYGHPDHRQAHLVAVQAAAVAGTQVVLQATAPADLFRAVLWCLRLIGHPLGVRPVRTAAVFSRRREIAHVVRVGPALDAKLAAIAAHSSQRRSSTSGPRVLDRLVELPRPVARLVLGREWFVDSGPRSAQSVLDLA